MRKLVDEGLTQVMAELEQSEPLSDLSNLSDIRLVKTTAVEGRISGYITAMSTGQYIDVITYPKPDLQSEEIDEAKNEILDIADNLVEEKNNPVVIENLLDSLNSELEKLWKLRHFREREFAKFIILIQTITKGKKDVNFNENQVENIAAILQIFKSPKIGEVDIKKCTKIIEDSGLNIYKTLIKSPKIKVIIQQEE